MLIVDKPSGWLTTPARLTGDARPCLGRILQSQLQQQIYPVHRLDLEVSGLTVWAKDRDSHQIAQTWFEQRRVKKKYTGFSELGKNPPPKELEIWKSILVRGKRRTFSAAHGKPSETWARVVRQSGEFYVWELFAVTGRSHQLRFEMSQHGFPLLGDTLYGGPKRPEQNWIALRAVELDLRGLDLSDRLGLPEICQLSDLEL